MSVRLGLSGSALAIAAMAALILVAPARAATPPLALIDELRATGPVYRLGPGGVVQRETLVVFVTDSLLDNNYGVPPRETIPAASRIDVRWHPTPGSRVIGYQYSVRRSGTVVTVDSSVRSVSLDIGNSPFVSDGFWLRAFDGQGGATEVNRWYQHGFSPASWFSGPDLASYPADPVTGERSIDVPDWDSPPAFPASLLSCDSLTLWPAERPERQTFFEIYGNRVYARAEDDTVHLNSRILLHQGGTDLDSPYDVYVAPSDPGIPDPALCGSIKVLEPGPPNGSPIAFQTQISEFLDPAGPLVQSQASAPYPNFNPSSFLRTPTIGFYRSMTKSGIAYAVARARDVDGNEDAGDPLPRRVLRFYVNRSPALHASDPTFVPQPHQQFTSRSITLHLPASDPDPFDRGNPPGPGGPSATQVLRWNVKILGTAEDGGSVAYSPLAAPVSTPVIPVTVPEWIFGPDVTLEVELCDCSDCEAVPGSGRCVTQLIPFVIPSRLTSTLVSLLSAAARPDLVRVRWRLGAGEAARVERRTAESGWLPRAEVRSDAGGEVAFEDRAIAAGVRYGYRLALGPDEGAPRAGEVWVDVPRGYELALDGARPNPSDGDGMTLHFGLSGDTGARLDLLDLSGRRVLGRDVGALGAGRHAIRIGAETRLPPGIYLVRLSEGAKVRFAKAVVLDR